MFIAVRTVPGVRMGFPSMSRGIAMTSSDTLSGTTMRGLRSTYCSSILRFCRRRREGWLRPRVSYRSLRFRRDGSENRRFGNRNGRGGDFPPRPLFAGTFPYFSGTGAFSRWLLSVFPAAEEAENDVGIRKRTERERKVSPGDSRQWSFRSKGGRPQREKRERPAGYPAGRWHVRGNPLFYPVEPGEGDERRGNADAVGRLVVFQQRGHNARQGERTAVECVGQLDFPVGVAVAKL